MTISVRDQGRNASLDPEAAAKQLRGLVDGLTMTAMVAVSTMAIGY